jgi:hypothetical protein
LSSVGSQLFIYGVSTSSGEFLCGTLSTLEDAADVK